MDEKEKVEKISKEEAEEEDQPEETEGLNYEEWKGSEVMESLCPSCGGMGKTRFMFHKIPYFREIILASFYCPACEERNNEVTFGGQIQLNGCKYKLKVTSPSDTNRQIIKSDSASIIIPEIDFEIPAKTQKGEINTIEGVLKTAAKNLAFSQPIRRIETPAVAQKIDEIIETLEAYSEGERLPYTIILDDPAGNSFIENPFVPKSDPHMTLHHYTRTKEQDAYLGIDSEKGVYKQEDSMDAQIMESLTTGQKTFGGSIHNHPSDNPSDSQMTTTITEGTGESEDDLATTKAVTLPSICPNCLHEGESHTAITQIPHFKEVIIMSFTCQICGFRTNEVKGGGSIPTYGTEVRLFVESEADLKRDLLKSDTTKVMIPELDLELQVGTLGGMFTSVEGLLQKILKNLDENSPIVYGDSKVLQHSNDRTVSESKTKFEEFLSQLSDYAFGRKFPFTLILRDPLGNSFISAPIGTFLPPESDKNIELFDYERSFEENEDLGINDMNTKDFETGVEEADALKVHGPVLPDRLTMTQKKMVDHPTFFAKGTDLNDNTMGGAYFKEKSEQWDQKHEPTDMKDSPEGEDYYQPPAGWSFEKNLHELPDYGRRTSDQTGPGRVVGRNLGDDSDLEYIPREDFGGYREGYVFRLGSKGMGYYQDRMTIHK